MKAMTISDPSAIRKRLSPGLLEELPLLDRDDRLRAERLIVARVRRSILSDTGSELVEWAGLAVEHSRDDVQHLLLRLGQQCI